LPIGPLVPAAAWTATTLFGVTPGTIW
jgi:hypothetical protein